MGWRDAQLKEETVKQILICAALLLSLMGGHASATQPAEVSRVEKSLKPATRALIESYRAKAMSGDYQAMRNMAFTWSTDAAKEQAAAAPIGCAWYALILKTHAQRANAGDQSNKELYCGRLSVDQARQAGAIVSGLEPELTGKPAAKY